MRKPIIIGNWKMHKTINETIDFLKQVDHVCHDLKLDAGIAIPFVNLAVAKQHAHNLIIAAQNCHYEDFGAFTGEISVEMLENLKITHVIIGHSERREMFNETNETVNLKAKKILAKGMVPIICCGETLQQYENNETQQIVETQIEKALQGIDFEDAKTIVIAYEPIWAIGTGKTATAEIAQNVCAIIRTKIASLYDEVVANVIRIQYGGSVKPENIQELLAQPDIDGALVGGASLEPKTFLGLVK
ncbi:triose-phosphate isomerase [Spiroplasma citri]|uniref:Triosephosphate isomerase n=1 Tax=Spiroplasma citri TaxID=2133 RepID=A0AAJ4EI93_SPICI|nr:triose-phosphate isomerase [Spiroplasma citri]APE74150.1 triosephosphate isomerase [Spiroplasma citri]QED24129.1 triose-phosphate isomerase [Spiroplasma citri]QIA66407.1 triose-phosphate isomerase [Spiroplasma citri]QIA68284.1 triose-phosphate isomerase [Spiroplasma citri]QIA70159.1 triose-phosphate isomerase [Spiroplasma citri]